VSSRIVWELTQAVPFTNAEEVQMNLSVELSMYPLQDGYKPKIKDFLEMLNSHANDVEIRTSNMSTRVFGDFDAVTELLSNCMKESMQR